MRRRLVILLACAALVIASLTALFGCGGPVGKATGGRRPTVEEAQALYESGEFGKAAEILRALVAEAPADVTMRRRLALAEAAAGRPAAAKEQLKVVLAAAPKDHESLFRLAMLERASGESTSAEARLERAVSLSPKRSYLEELAKTRMLLHKPAEANEVWRRLLRERSISADQRKSYLVQEGECLLALGRREDAAEAWAEALRLDPDDEGLAAKLAPLRKAR